MNAAFCTINDVKKLTCYDRFQDLIDSKLGNALDELKDVSFSICNDLLIAAQLQNGQTVYLPIIAMENGHRLLTEAEIQQAQILEYQRKQALAQISKNAQKIDQRKARNAKADTAFILDQDDKREWWAYLEEHYPRNYNLAKRYYSDGEDSILAKLGLSKRNYTVNEYFEIYGLPKIFTDENHVIKVVKNTSK